MCLRAGIILPAIYAAALSLNASASSAGEAPPAGSTAAPDSTSAVGAASALRSDIKLHFDLAAGPLDKALRDFAVQASRNISYEPSIVAGLQAPAIKGEFTVDDALSLLLKGTKLHAVNVDAKTIRILDKANSAARGAAEGRDNLNLHDTDIGTTSQMSPNSPPSSGTSPEPESKDSSSNDARMHSKNDLAEITVTGTHIRGTKDSPSPVLVFTRDDIDAAGANTIQQFLQSLPQNFGGASENTIGTVASSGQTNNAVNGSAPNLRGLGASATLVLINGHRVAPGNSDGSFVDISMIPLTAVERIEIVTDGASAIYGSDAVGGVVNIILRTKFDGAETRVQYGSVSDGSMHNVQVGQTVGTDWTNGSGVLSYQYFDQTPLSAASRDYLRSVPLPFDLLPVQVQQSVFANADQEVAPGFNVHGDAIYSHRGTNTAFSQEVPPNYYTGATPSEIDFYSMSLGSTLKLPRQSELTVTATYSESDTAQQDYETGESLSPFEVLKSKATIISVDANLDGVLVSLPAGPVRYAVGAQYRKESFGNTFILPVTDNTFYPSRNVDAGYVELHVPVIGQTTSSRGDPALELTLADRAEHYSDFGSTNNPQFGLIGKTSSSVTIRGTYGTSFVAPLLSQLNPVPSQVVPFPSTLFNPVPGQTIPNTLAVFGGNPDLGPEKARVWTVGLDFKPPEVEGLTAKLTYYDIVFTNEIANAQASENELDAFVDEAILGPNIVQRNPPSSLVQKLIAEPTYENFFNVNPATIGAIYDSESMNLSSVKARGLDFGFGYKRTILGTGIDTGIDGGYIFAFHNQFSSTAPVVSILNTSYNPINLRLRARALATRGPLSGGVYINFTNDYSDNNVIPYGHVSSWTTADAVGSYEIGSSGGPFNGAAVALSVINLTNRAPPYVSNPSGYPITYDGSNANALGRYISLRLQKRW
jgi:outer membrane receptor protein involved in Fe transport